MIITLKCDIQYEEGFANVYDGSKLIASQNPKNKCLRVPPLFERINKLSQDKCESLIIYFNREEETIEPVVIDSCYISVETFLLKNSFVHYKSQTDEYPL